MTRGRDSFGCESVTRRADDQPDGRRMDLKKRLGYELGSYEIRRVTSDRAIIGERLSFGKSQESKPCMKKLLR